MDFKTSIGGGVKLTGKEWARIKPLKELDVQICEFCQRVNIFNLG